MWLGLNRWMRLGAMAMAVGSVAASCRDGADATHESLHTLASEQCDHMLPCGCATTLDPDRACGEIVRQRWDERIAAARDRGLTFDPQCVEALFERLQIQGCADATAGDAHLCKQYCAVFFGTQQEGEPCEAFDGTTSDCAQDLACDGTCKDPCLVLTGRTLGETCVDPESGTTIEACAQGLTCDYVTGQCRPLAAAGESCFDRACVPGLWCLYDTQTCEPEAGEGQACDGRPCADGLWCLYDTTAVCVPNAGLDEPCIESQCEAGLYCDYEANRCREPTREGESCDSVPCDEGLLCDFETTRCAAPPDVGHPCLQMTCAARAWCDANAMPEPLCRERVPTGEACSGHPQCESVYCPAGYCEPRPAEGEDCTAVGLCQHGLVCDGSVCVPAVATGAAVCGYPGW